MANQTIKEVVVITTGGTIAMGEKTPGKGAVPSLSGDDLLKVLPPLPRPVRIVIDNFRNVPSAHLSLENLWELAERVRNLSGDREDIGFVITMGTDILEEAVYFIDLTVGQRAPVVMTGAMRTASQVGYDGYANLYHSLIVASSMEKQKVGTVLVANEEIHGAREVQKTHSTNVGTFISPGWGPLGWIVEGNAWFHRMNSSRETIAGKPPFPSVELIRCTAGMDGLLLETCLQSRVAGIVIEAFGVGHVPLKIADLMEAGVNKGIPVVAVSRCSMGSVLTRTYGFPGSESDLVRRGVIMGRGITGPKARMKLTLALAAGEGLIQIKKRFMEEEFLGWS
jgi:L-asparaginase